uniref:Ubiquitin-related modifier 1 n=1 Tax=Astyanax mexicanus TaxID=7994 RepID=A0A8B9GP52_ASTMX
IRVHCGRGVFRGGGSQTSCDSFEFHRGEPSWDMKQLLAWIRVNLLKERPELFVQGDTVNTGLILIPDIFFFLCVFFQGELEYQLQDQDNVVFISTLHGG